MKTTATTRDVFDTKSPHSIAEVFVEVVSEAIYTLVRVSLERIKAEEAAEQKRSGNGPALLRAKEACEYLATCKSKFYQLVKAKILVPVETDFGPRYRREDLDRYIKEHLRKE